MKTFVKLLTIAFALFLFGTQAKANTSPMINSHDLVIQIQDFETVDLTTITTSESLEVEPDCEVELTVKVVGIGSLRFKVSGKCSEIADAVKRRVKEVVQAAKDALK